jgi:hypothetical protein
MGRVLTTVLTLATLAGMAAAETIYFDDFDNGGVLADIDGRIPATNNGTNGTVWVARWGSGDTSKDKIQSNAFVPHADGGANLSIIDGGAFELPNKVTLSATLMPGDGTGTANGIGFGFTTQDVSAGAGQTDVNLMGTPKFRDDFNGLAINGSNELVLVESDNNGKINSYTVIATGLTAGPYNIAYTFDLTTGDIWDIVINGVRQTDITTTVFSDHTWKSVAIVACDPGSNYYADNFALTDPVPRGTLLTVW